MNDDFELIHKFNMRITFNQCHELVPKLAELKFHWIEEPVDRWGRIRRGPEGQTEDSEKAIDWHLKIREAAKGFPVSGGDTKTERSDFKNWIERDAFDFVQLDCDSKGLRESNGTLPSTPICKASLALPTIGVAISLRSRIFGWWWRSLATKSWSLAAITFIF